MKQLSKQLVWGFGALAACDGDHGTVDLRTQEVTAVCVTSGASAPAGAWFCPAPLTVQCGASVPPLYVENVAGCEQSSLSVSDVLLGQSGVQSVEVRRPDGGLACATTLTVLDSAGPVLTPQVINIWPPNHKFHTISVEDCVGAYDACDPSVTAEFVWASSDEPVDDLGDGHHAPDILIDGCDRVQVPPHRTDRPWTDTGPRPAGSWWRLVPSLRRSAEVSDGTSSRERSLAMRVDTELRARRAGLGRV